MAEDDAISAMWRSLVPTTEYGEDATVFTPTDFSIRNPPFSAEIETVSGMRAVSNCMGAEHFHRPQNDDSEVIEYKNQQVIVHGHPKAEELDLQLAILHDIKTLSNHAQAEVSDPPTNELVVPRAVKKLYRVPDATRKANPDFYEPQFMPLGPYHHPSVRPAEEYKNHFAGVIRRSGTGIPMSKYIHEIRAESERVESYYEEINVATWQYSLFAGAPNYTWKSLFLDACCILGFFGILEDDMQQIAVQPASLSKSKPKIEPELEQQDQEPEPVFEPNLLFYPFNSKKMPRWGTHYFLHDIILMENQIPFFIVETIYGLFKGRGDVSSSLRRQIVTFIHKYLLRAYSTSIDVDDAATQQFEHILHYCHMYFRPPSSTQHNDSSTTCSIEDNDSISSSTTTQHEGNTKLNRLRRAADLYNMAGIKFKRSDDDKRSLLNITFDKWSGTLEIPFLFIDGRTGSLFKNIIAFEQSLGDSSGWHNSYFTSYVKFMADLMTTEEDVTLLARKRIIENHLGKDELVMDLFKKLMKGVSLSLDEDNYLTQTRSDLENYYESRPNKWVAYLRKHHLKNPWVILGVVTSSVLVVFSAIQVITSLTKKN